MLYNDSVRSLLDIARGLVRSAIPDDRLLEVDIACADSARSADRLQVRVTVRALDYGLDIEAASCLLVGGVTREDYQHLCACEVGRTPLVRHEEVLERHGRLLRARQQVTYECWLTLPSECETCFFDVHVRLWLESREGFTDWTRRVHVKS